MSTSPSADALVVGAGIAGLTAATTLCREGFRVSVVDPLCCGGQLATIGNVPNFPGYPNGILGVDLGANLVEQALNSGCSFTYSMVKSLAADQSGWAVGLEDGDRVSAPVAIIATGSSIAHLGIPGEEKYAGRGVISCATCDGWAFKGKRICVVGGGDSALDACLYLSGFAEEVVLVYPEAQPIGAKASSEQVRSLANVRQLPHHRAAGVLGDNVVTGLRILNTHTGVETELKVDGVAGYPGFVRNTELFFGVLPIDGASGVHVHRDTMETAQRGLFAVGDVREASTFTLLASAADGAVAARSATAQLTRIQSAGH